MFKRDLIRISETEHTSIWVLFKIWRLGWVRDTKFDMNISNEKLLNAANIQVYSFLRFLFWVIKLKLIGGISPSPRILGLIDRCYRLSQHEKFLISKLVAMWKANLMYIILKVVKRFHVYRKIEKKIRRKQKNICRP